MTRGNRPGAALVIALVVLVIIECVIVGTMHLAMMERRVAHNALLAARLRLAAGSAARAAAVRWSPALDSLAQGVRFPVHADSAGSIMTHATVERLNGGLLLVRATAEEPPPGHGRTAAAVIVVPPALPAGINPAAAAVSATTVVAADGAAIMAEGGECGGYVAVRLGGGRMDVAATAVVIGEVESIQKDLMVTRNMTRLAVAAAAAAKPEHVLFVDGSARIDHAFTGVVIAGDDVIVPDGGRVRGLVVAGRDVVIEQGATVEGAVHAAGLADVHGAVRVDACAVRDVLTATGLDRPRPFPGRSWIPAF
jgi:Tfp pilus assembly protein PilX